MRLKQLLIKGIEEKYNFKNLDIKGICTDSRVSKKEEIFVALKGTRLDGHKYIDRALGRGINCVVLDKRQARSLSKRLKKTVLIGVRDTRKALIELAAKFYGPKLKGLDLIGVTGTNGKTTVTYLIESILNCAGFKTGLIGTIDIHLAERKETSVNTTPALVELYKYFLEMKKKGLSRCIMEVSSHALDQDRVGGLKFKWAIFTNLSRDHLDYHKNFQNYFAAKRKLFFQIKPRDGCAIVNIDDAYGRKLLRKKSLIKISYGIKRGADVVASDIEQDLTETRFLIRYSDEILSVKSKLLGLHNVYNILAAVALALSMEISSKNLIEGIERLKAVPGRLQLVGRFRGSKIFIDYAHTPVALKEVLESLRQLQIKIKGARIILVFGCGGERDKLKRPQMGRLASLFCDFVILTSDNPRGEDPKAIISDIKQGFKEHNFEVIEDRYKAIKQALSLARNRDIVLIAGKGHERVQIFDKQTVAFDDANVVRQILKELKA